MINIAGIEVKYFTILWTCIFGTMFLQLLLAGVAFKEVTIDLPPFTNQAWIFILILWAIAPRPI